MKEFSWDDCLRNSSSFKKSSNKPRVQSLLGTAKARVTYFNSSSITEGNVNFVFEGYYSSVLELLHAFVLLNGYAVANHVCLGFYLRDVLDRKDLFTLFDSCRFNRNSLVYYGERMDFEVAKDSVLKCKKLISELNKLLSKDI
jgi:hypothetical protein